MDVLIDGHNALHRLGLWGKGDHEQARRTLLSKVRRAAPEAIVFFDARDAPAGIPRRAREDGVRVVYCSRREADAEILDRVRNSSLAQGLLVVTDDRELAGRAQQLGARHEAVAEFFEAGGAPLEPGPGADSVELPKFKAEDFDLPDEIDLEDPDLD
ncbi:MAG: NYN domain-containing protein [Planctomycetota bacterium]|nr:NYN domain-containing protein [Planctomycetota bacterium]